jgi:hypothetical protein
MYAGITVMYAGITIMQMGITAIATAFLGQKVDILHLSFLRSGVGTGKGIAK